MSLSPQNDRRNTPAEPLVRLLYGLDLYDVVNQYFSSFCIEIEKTCQWCGKRFIARTTVTAYCSHRCSGLAYKERKRQKKVEQCKEEQKRVQTGQAEIQEKEFLSPRDAAQLVGVCYKTFYNYINNGSIKAWKMKRKTLVRRVDVEGLFTASHERLTVDKEEKAITDFYTTQEVLEKYKLSNGWFWKVAKEQKFPKTCKF